MEKIDENSHFPTVLDKVKIICDNRSTEAYFGKDAPLSLILKKYSKLLKEMFSETKKISIYNKKEFINNLKTVCDNFDKELSNELNMEKVTFIVNPDFNTIDASSFCMTAFDNTDKIFKDGKEIEYISTEKYIDIENIVCTRTGYKFKEKKNKFGLIIISAKAIWENSEDELAAIICHEIGHMFQQGVFGSYKYYSDQLIAKDIKDIMNYNMSGLTGFGLFNNTVMKSIKLLINYILFPRFLTTGIFTKFGLWLQKNVFHKIIDEKTFLLKEKSRYDDDKYKNTKEYKQIATMSQVAADDYTVNNRKELIQDYKNSNYEAFKIKQKIFDTTDNKNPIAKLSLWLYRTYLAISMDLNARDQNFFDLITFNSYTINTYEKNVFYHKYEFFADIFASSYGFSKSLYSSLLVLERNDNKNLETIYKHGFYNVPIIGVWHKIALHRSMRRNSRLDVHSTVDARVTAVYTALINEINSNTDLTPIQKTELETSIKEIKSMDDQFYDDLQKTGGFFYKYYNKVIDHRIRGTDKTVEEKILGPLKDVCMEK